MCTSMQSKYYNEDCNCICFHSSKHNDIKYHFIHIYINYNSHRQRFTNVILTEKMFYHLVTKDIFINKS